MKPPEIIHATQAKLDALFVLAKASSPIAQYKAASSILLGARTEHKRNVLAALASVEAPADGTVDEGAAATDARSRLGVRERRSPLLGNPTRPA